jgi:hypothetical protein
LQFERQAIRLNFKTDSAGRARIIPEGYVDHLLDSARALDFRSRAVGEADHLHACSKAVQVNFSASDKTSPSRSGRRRYLYRHG